MATTDECLLDLKKRVLEENEYVKNLIDNIPPIYYFDKATFKEINNIRHQDLHNELNRMGLSNGKPSTISKKTKLKRLKLIPERQITVTQLLREFAEGEDDDDEEEAEEVLEKSNANNNLQLDKDELIQRLQTRINDLRGGRKPTEEKLERQRLKRKLSKLKSKKNRQNAKKSNVMERKLLNGGNERINDGFENSTKPKPIFNKEGKMVFSKFDFSESGIPERKKGKAMPAAKDYKQLLVKVQNEKTKLNEIREKDPKKAELMQEKQSWLKAIQKAEGVKIKDDPALLKRALKRKEQRSKKSKKEWEGRDEKVKEKQEKRQKKRKDNIKAKRDDKVKKKIKRAVKKGRYIPA